MLFQKPQYQRVMLCRPVPFPGFQGAQLPVFWFLFGEGTVVFRPPQMFFSIRTNGARPPFYRMVVS